MKDLLKLIQESVDGNFDSFHLLKSYFLVSYSNQNILNELKKELTLYLHKKKLCHVLQQYKQGSIKSDLLQQWAFLVREGHFEPYYREYPNRWINVIYESEYDLEHDTELWNQMNEILYRLYEIGDIVDGEILEEELEDWLNCFCKNEGVKYIKRCIDPLKEH